MALAVGVLSEPHRRAVRDPACPDARTERPRSCDGGCGANPWGSVPDPRHAPVKRFSPHESEHLPTPSGNPLARRHAKPSRRRNLFAPERSPRRDVLRPQRSVTSRGGDGSPGIAPRAHRNPATPAAPIQEGERPGEVRIGIVTRPLETRAVFECCGGGHLTRQDRGADLDPHVTPHRASDPQRWVGRGWLRLRQGEVFVPRPLPRNPPPPRRRAGRPRLVVLGLRRQQVGGQRQKRCVQHRSGNEGHDEPALGHRALEPNSRSCGSCGGDGDFAQLQDDPLAGQQTEVADICGGRRSVVVHATPDPSSRDPPASPSHDGHDRLCPHPRDHRQVAGAQHLPRQGEVPTSLPQREPPTTPEGAYREYGITPGDRDVDGHGALDKYEPPEFLRI